MRFNETAVLQGVHAHQREDGTFSETKTSRSVFVNSYGMGATAYMAAKAAGLHADAEVQLRTCDYSGEQGCVFHGTAYDVERTEEKGDFTVLTLKRRLRDG